MLALCLLLLGVAGRLMAHQPNFTPVLALVLFGGVYLRRKYAFVLPLALMMATDLMLGFHNIMAFTWGSLIVIAALGLWLRGRKNFLNVAIAGLASAVLFFVVTNFGVWTMGYYPPTFQGLVDCYVMAIPFFRSSVVSTLVYSAVLFGVYEGLAWKIRSTRLASALL